jgi:hypothetical protein
MGLLDSSILHQGYVRSIPQPWIAVGDSASPKLPSNDPLFGIYVGKKWACVDVFGNYSGFQEISARGHSSRAK